MAAKAENTKVETPKTRTWRDGDVKNINIHLNENGYVLTVNRWGHKPIDYSFNNVGELNEQVSEWLEREFV